MELIELLVILATGQYQVGQVLVVREGLRCEVIAMSCVELSVEGGEAHGWDLSEFVWPHSLLTNPPQS